MDYMNQCSGVKHLIDAAEGVLPYLSGDAAKNVRQALEAFRHQITLSWDVIDILEYEVEEDVTAQQIGMTGDDAVRILNEMEKYHDASYGINWGTIEACIDLWRHERKSLKKKISKK